MRSKLTRWLTVILVLVLPAQALFAQLSVCPHMQQQRDVTAAPVGHTAHDCCQDADDETNKHCYQCGSCTIAGSVAINIAGICGSCIDLDHSQPLGISFHLISNFSDPLFKPPRFS